jgi:hypothetical protein
MCSSSVELTDLSTVAANATAALSSRRVGKATHPEVLSANRGKIRAVAADRGLMAEARSSSPCCQQAEEQRVEGPHQQEKSLEQCARLL